MKRTAVIRAFANGGEAVGNLEDGKTVFVRGAVPGETVEVEILQEKQRYSRARLVSVIQSSGCRIASDCPHFPACPGCSYRHVPYQTELEWKQKQLEYMARDYPDIKFNPPVGAKSRNHWRNKLTLHISNGVCGLISDDNYTVTPVKSCLLAVPEINELIRHADLSKNFRPTWRYTRQDGAMLLKENKDSRVLTEELENHGTFKVNADAFFQTNNAMADKLVSRTVELVKASGKKRLYELYCGAGVFSAACLEKIPYLEAEAVEITASSIIRARTNAAMRGVSGRCRFFAGDAGKFFEKCSPEKGKFLLLTDPPRTGMDKTAINSIKKHLPEKIIYISCAADTLVRDIRALSEHYRPVEMTVFDMFPGTAHFEVLTVLELI